MDSGLPAIEPRFSASSHMRESGGACRSALFVDFDNIYIGLRELNPAAAERFGEQPEGWLTWLTERLPTPWPFARGSRRILVRRCYMNPVVFHNYRAPFTASAFQVVDCPPLTRQSKTSTDIHMVMDIMDALVHPTRFDEFILLSGDADFTPVLTRLRAHDRRTAVLAVGPSATAYRRACEHFIDEDAFLTLASGGNLLHDPIVAGDDELLKTVAEAIADRIRRTGRAIIAPTELVAVLRRFPEFVRGNNWFGFGAIAPLLTRLMELLPELTYGEQPFRIDLKPTNGAQQHVGESGESEPRPTDFEWVPPPSAVPSYSVSTRLPPIAERVHQVAQTPLLDSGDYARLYSVFADKLEQQRRENWPLQELSKEVRGECQRRGLRLSPSDISFVFKGVAYAMRAEPPEEGDEPEEEISPERVGHLFHDSVTGYCRDRQLELNEEQQSELSRWLLGGLETHV